MIKSTFKYGLSLGDRACLATSMYLGRTVYTTDKAWARIDIKGIDIKFIR